MDRVEIIQTLPFGPFLRLHFRLFFLRPQVLLLYGLSLWLLWRYLAQELGFSGELPPSWGWLYLLFAFGVVPAGIWFNALSMRQSHRALWEQTHIQFSDERIEIRSASHEASFAWEAIYRVQEGRGWFLFYLGRSEVFYVYKPFFRDAGDIAILRALIRRKPEVKQSLRQR
jgi:hypothetical protein